MSKLDWRNNKIHKLKGDPSDDTILPTYAQYLVWQGNAERSITAVGANYLNNSIKKIEEKWDGTTALIIGDDENIPDFHNSDVFRQKLVELAVECGRESAIYPNPTINPAVVKINYDMIYLDLTSLGQQVSSTCQKHFPEIFNDTEIKKHPLRAVMEWINLKRSFDPFVAGADPSTYWDKLSQATDKKVLLDPAWIHTWLKDITQARNNLIQLAPVEAVDSSIKGKILRALKSAKHADQSVQLTWLFKANRLLWGTLWKEKKGD